MVPRWFPTGNSDWGPVPDNLQQLCLSFFYWRGLRQQQEDRRRTEAAERTSLWPHPSVCLPVCPHSPCYLHTFCSQGTWTTISVTSISDRNTNQWRWCRQGQWDLLCPKLTQKNDFFFFTYHSLFSWCHIIHLDIVVYHYRLHGVAIAQLFCSCVLSKTNANNLFSFIFIGPYCPVGVLYETASMHSSLDKVVYSIE